jgi:translocation and assembly module TamB
LKVLRPALLLFVLLISSVLYLALFTEQGTRSALRLAEQLLPLQIEYDGGSLAGRLILNRLLFETNEVRVELVNVVVELAPGCLWRGAICFEQLQIGRLDIAVLPGSEAEQTLSSASANGPASLIEFPVPLETDSLELKRLRVHWQGGEWQQGAMLARVRVQHVTIEVLSADIAEPQLVLQDTGNPDDGGARSTALPVIDLPLNLSVTDLQLHHPSWDFYGETFKQDKIVLTGCWLRSELQVHELRVSSEEMGDLSLHGDLTFSGDWPIAADADIALAESLQQSSLFGRVVTATVRNSLAALEVQLNAPGTVALAVHGRVDLHDGALPFSATVTATSPGRLAMGGIAGVPAQLENVELEFPLLMSVSGSLDVQRFEFKGGARGLGYDSLRIDMVGQYEEQALVISDLSIQDASENNTLQASGDILLSSDHPWSLVLQSSGLDLPALSEALRGRLDGAVQLGGTVAGERWQVRVVDAALHGQINDMPARIAGFTGIDSDLRLLGSALEAQLNGAQLSLRTAGDALGTGKLQLTIADIGRWQVGSRGQLQLDAEISPDREHIQLAGSMRNVEWSGLRFDRATITADYRAAADRAFRFDTKVSEVGIGDVNFTTLQFLAQGDARKQSLSVTGSGDIQGDIEIQGAVQGEEWRGELLPTRLQTPIGDWALTDRVAMSAPASMEQLSLAAQCWQHQYARLCTGDWLVGKRGGGSVQLQSDLKIIAGLLPSDVEVKGDLQMQLDARWEADAAARATGSVQTGAVTITQHFTEGESATFGWDQTDALVNLGGEGLKLDIGVQRDSRELVGLELLLPPDRNDAVTGAISLNRLELGALAPFVPALSTLAGELSAQLKLAGTVDELQAFGEISLTDGRLIAEGNPTELDQLNVNLDVQGDWASIRGDAFLGGGELQFFGKVHTDPELQMELTLEGAGHTIFYPPSTELKISEALLLTLKRDLLILTGGITVDDGVLQIEELPVDSVALSPSVIEVDTYGKALHEELPFDVRMNLQIHIADRFAVTGSNVQTRLGGDLRVQQRPGRAPQMFGNLELVGGEFRAYQTRLQIKRGTLSFTGPLDNPTLDVRAERHISSGDVTVGLHVQGPLENDLQLELYSNPAMTQTDAMSYLVRGRGMDAGAGLDGTSAALSLASGAVNRSDLVTELNRIPGISNVEFGAQGSEADTAATVSGYLGERIYLAYGVGLYEPVNVLTARFYLRSRFWLEVVSSLENSVDLYYSFDID